MERYASNGCQSEPTQYWCAIGPRVCLTAFYKLELSDPNNLPVVRVDRELEVDSLLRTETILMRNSRREFEISGV